MNDTVDETDNVDAYADAQRQSKEERKHKAVKIKVKSCKTKSIQSIEQN